MNSRALSASDPPDNRLEGVQNCFKTAADTQVNKRKEHCGQGRHHKDHNRRQKDFATGRPDNLGDLCARLLNKLCWVGTSHDESSLLDQGLTYAAKALNSRVALLPFFPCHLRHTAGIGGFGSGLLCFGLHLRQVQALRPARWQFVQTFLQTLHSIHGFLL